MDRFPKSIIYAFVFFSLFFVYNSNFNAITSGDNTPTSLLPSLIIKEKTIYLDRFYPEFVCKDIDPSTTGLYYLRKSGCHIIAEKSTLFALIITPLYAGLLNLVELFYPDFLPEWQWSPGSIPPQQYFIMEKFAASFLAAATAIIVFTGLCSLLRSRRTALILTGIYALGTSHWSISSQGLWVHGGSEFFSALLLCAWARDEEGNGSNQSLVIGTVAAVLLVAVRISNVFFSIAWALYLYTRRQKYYQISIILMSIAAVACFNRIIYGSFLGIYAHTGKLFYEFGWKENLLAWAGLLVSPGRGLFFYSPIFILSVIGGYSVIKAPKGNLFLICIMAASLGCYGAAATYTDGSPYLRWGGGHSYGPRYFADMMPFLIFLLIPGYRCIKRLWLKSGSLKKNVITTVLLLFLSWSVFTQAVGVYFYKSHHNRYPVNIDSSPERLWDFTDNPVYREFSTGINPTTAYFYQLFGAILKKTIILLAWRVYAAARMERGNPGNS
jgi:hypothetical protein